MSLSDTLNLFVGIVWNAGRRCHGFLLFSVIGRELRGLRVGGRSSCCKTDDGAGEPPAEQRLCRHKSSAFVVSQAVRLLLAQPSPRAMGQNTLS